MKFLKPAAFVVGTVVALGAAVATADATTYDWTLTGPAANLGGVPFPASGTLTTTGDQVTAITGTIDGSTISALTTFESGDNLVFPNTDGTSLLDGDGLSFDTLSGLDVNIYGFDAVGSPASGNAYAEIASPGGSGVGTFTLTATPLPAALPLFASGLGAVGFLGRRKKRKALAA